MMEAHCADPEVRPARGHQAVLPRSDARVSRMARTSTVRAGALAALVQDDAMLEQLQKALSTAYSLDTLQRLVRFKLGRDLYDYAAPGNKQQVIFELLEAAQREGFVEQLIAAARDFNPGNETLREFAFQYGVESTKKSGQELQRLIGATRSNLDPVQLRQHIFEAETRVCRIEIATPDGRLHGTGFLVQPDVIMTNYHVMEPVIAGTVSTDRVDIRFDYKRTAARVISEGTSCPLAAEWLVDMSELGDVEQPEDDELDYAMCSSKKHRPIPVRHSAGIISSPIGRSLRRTPRSSSCSIRAAAPRSWRWIRAPSWV